MQKEFVFAVDEIESVPFSDYDENEYAVARMKFLSDRPNSHGLVISKEVLKEYAKSVLGAWVISDVRLGDATGHTENQSIYGLFPKEQEVQFEEDEDGYTYAVADAIISKRYGKEYYHIFENNNHRYVSVEATFNLEDDGETVTGFDIKAVTTLGSGIMPSCPDASTEIIRFSEQEAENAYKTFAEKKTYKIDKSKDSVSNTPWGDVDKVSMKDKIMEAKNRSTLVNSVYALTEPDWESAPSEHLKYPIMELKDDTFVYNKNALASALAYAKKENESDVISKVEKIRKKLGLDSDGKEEQKMEIEFAAVNIRDMWDALNIAIDRKQEWRYAIEDIYKENDQLFAILRNWDEVEKRYRLDFKYDENGVELPDEVVEVKTEFVETDTIKKFARPEEMEKCEEMPDEPDDEDDDSKEEPDDDSDEEKDEKMSVEDMQTKIDELSRQIEEKENIIMDKENKMSEMSIELENLRSYKATVLARENACAVDALMSEVKPFIDNEKFAEFKAEGLSCTEDTFDAWKNKVQAVCFANVSKNLKKNDLGVFTFAAPVENKELKSGSVWDRIKNHNNI